MHEHRVPIKKWGCKKKKCRYAKTCGRLRCAAGGSPSAFSSRLGVIYNIRSKRLYARVRSRPAHGLVTAR